METGNDCGKNAGGKYGEASSRISRGGARFSGDAVNNGRFHSDGAKSQGIEEDQGFEVTSNVVAVPTLYPNGRHVCR